LIAETEPNDDGSPDVGGGQSGNDFAADRAQTVDLEPIDAERCLVGSLGPSGDEDYFRLTNTGTPTLALTAFVSMPNRDGCPSTPVRLLLRGADGVVLETKQSSSGGNCIGFFAFFHSIVNGETVFLELMAQDDAGTTPYAVCLVSVRR
jgi:hypothetical protein